MKKSKLTKRITFLLDSDDFREFSIKAATLGQKWSSRIRELIIEDLKKK